MKWKLKRHDFTNYRNYFFPLIIWSTLSFILFNVKPHLLPVVKSVRVVRVVLGFILHRGSSVTLRQVKVGVNSVDIQNQLTSIWTQQKNKSKTLFCKEKILDELEHSSLLWAWITSMLAIWQRGPAVYSKSYHTLYQWEICAWVW